MRLSPIRVFHLSLIFIFTFQSIGPLVVSARSISKTLPARNTISPPTRQSSTIRIRENNPVINENNQVTLTAVDANGQPITGVTWESGSPEVASVDPQTGVVRGVLRGYATVTARRGSETFSVFVTVARVQGGNGAKVPGDTKTDTGGRIYISDPNGSIILRKDGFTSPATVFAGQRGANGRVDGPRLTARFNTPTAVAVDNNAQGGVYVADTANHSIRKIGFDDRVLTTLGNGSPGVMTTDQTPLEAAVFRAPRGVASDTGGNLFVADTENHAIFYVDFARQEVRLLAGTPGQSGKTDGRGRAARFNRPTGVTLSTDGRFICVADTGNNRVRLITRDGQVATLGRNSTAKGSVFFPGQYASSLVKQVFDGDELVFDTPQSVGIDGLENIYVVDKTGVQVVIRPAGQSPQVAQLAQIGTFQAAASVVVRGNESFVLDTSATTEAEAVKVVTLGAPEITSLSQDTDRLEGGAEVVISGRNFAPESQVVLGDAVAEDATVESATRIRFRVPAQTVPGLRTLSVQTRGGVAQRVFSIVAKSLSELKPGEITTVAGGVQFFGDGGSALSAGFNFGAVESQFGGTVAIDGAGNFYVADHRNHRVRRVDQSGIITTIAGTGLRGFSGDNNLAIRAALNNPNCVALDSAGNLLIADTDNKRIRRVDLQTGIISTIAGGGTGGDGGLATEADLFSPSYVIADPAGNVLFSDFQSHRVQRIDAQTGILTTIAGTGVEGFSGDGGPATQARLTKPFGLALDSTGNLFIADGFNHRIRRVDTQGRITTYAGDGADGDFNQGRFRGDGGLATAASLGVPTALALDAVGNLFIADFFNSRVRRINANSLIIDTFAGNGGSGFVGDGGPATQAEINDVTGVAIDGAGNLFLTDVGSDRVRRVDAQTSTINTVAGSGRQTFQGDGGLANRAGLYVPRAVTLDQNGNLFISDQGNGYIRRVDATTGIIQSIAGNGDTFGGGEDSDLALESSVLNCLGIAVDPTGANLYLTLREGGRVWRVTNGRVTTVAGGGQNGLGDGGPATQAQVFDPVGVHLDAAGNLLITELTSHRIRRVNVQNGIITTVAGSGPIGHDSGSFSGDGGPATSALLNLPSAVRTDAAGNLLIADTLNFRIRRVAAQSGTISTIAGGGDDDFGENVPATQVGLLPWDLALDAAGNIFVAGQDRIRRIDARTGIITTLAGVFQSPGYSGDGGLGTAAQIQDVRSLAFDREGNLYFADVEANVIRVLKGVGVAAPSIAISNATYTKPNLTITGSGFGSTGARVTINGTDVSRFLKTQTDTTLTLKGNQKKLKLVKGNNQIVVTANGVTSNTFVLPL